jgi:hypothetical protein
MDVDFGAYPTELALPWAMVSFEVSEERSESGSLSFLSSPNCLIMS